MLRRRVRRAFLFAAVTFIGAAALGISRADVLVERHGPVQFAGVMFGCALLGLLYGMAWYTTRQPSEYRNNWAVAASGLSLIWGVVLVWAGLQFRPGDFAYMIPGVMTVLTGGAGLYLYAPGGSPEKLESAVATVQAQTAKTFVPPPPSGRKPSSAAPAVAPSVAAMRGSSPEIVAAMEPNASWDPLMALRTPDTLKKLRT
ncbi:MAG TPA: hypothetical protein VJU82_18675 [Acidobacteriaceae bacterium]|nr:hypothetical protein [Acidobacteriaceae bacterium]